MYKKIGFRDILDKLAVYLNDRYLDSRSSEFVQFITCDISKFLETATLRRVLVFPPIDSYFRLLIHQTVQSGFKNLCSFSIGAEEKRRTVVCFQESIYRAIIAEQEKTSIPDYIEKVRQTVCMSRERWDHGGWERGRGRGRGVSRKTATSNMSDEQQISFPSKSKASRPGLYSDTKTSGPKYESNERPYMNKHTGHATKDFRTDSSLETEDLSQKEASMNPAPKPSRVRRGRPTMQVYVPRGRRTENQAVNTDNGQSSTANNSKESSMRTEEGMNRKMALKVSEESENKVQSNNSRRNKMQKSERNRKEVSEGLGYTKDNSSAHKRKKHRSSEQNTESDTRIGKGLDAQNSYAASNVCESIQSGADFVTNIEHSEMSDGLYNDDLSFHVSSNLDKKFSSQEDVSGGLQRFYTEQSVCESQSTHRDSESPAQINKEDQSSTQSKEQGDIITHSDLEKHSFVIENDGVPRVESEMDVAENIKSNGKSIYNQTLDARIQCEKTIDEESPAEIKYLEPESLEKSDDFDSPCQTIANLPNSNCDDCEETLNLSDNDIAKIPESVNPSMENITVDDSKPQQEIAILSDNCESTENDNEASNDVSEKLVSKTSDLPKLENNAKDSISMVPGNISEKEENANPDPTSQVENIDVSTQGHNIEVDIDQGTEANTDDASNEKMPNSKPEEIIRKEMDKNVDEVIEQGEAEEEDTWDALFDDDGEALDPSLMAELTIAVGKDVEVKKTQFDYYSFQPKDPDLDYAAYDHLIEIYDFPKEFITRDLIIAFHDFMDKGFDIKWVDDTHAIGVFASAVAAHSALQTRHPMLKVRPLCQATRASKVKAKRSSEFLQPYKPRPETVASVARNLVAGALGLRSNAPRELRAEERRKIQEAKEKKREARKQKQDTWDGRIGQCAMDED